MSTNSGFCTRRLSRPSRYLWNLGVSSALAGGVLFCFIFFTFKIRFSSLRSLESSSGTISSWSIVKACKRTQKELYKVWKICRKRSILLQFTTPSFKAEGLKADPKFLVPSCGVPRCAVPSPWNFGRGLWPLSARERLLRRFLSDFRKGKRPDRNWQSSCRNNRFWIKLMIQETVVQANTIKFEKLQDHFMLTSASSFSSPHRRSLRKVLLLSLPFCSGGPFWGPACPACSLPCGIRSSAPTHLVCTSPLGEVLWAVLCRPEDCRRAGTGRWFDAWALPHCPSYRPEITKNLHENQS